MKHFSQNVLVRNHWISNDFSTEPIEVAWANEAIFFIQVRDIDGDLDCLNVKIQISPNGIDWIDEGSNFEEIKKKGLFFKKVNHFGGWLRLNCTFSETDSSVRLLVYLILKE